MTPRELENLARERTTDAPSGHPGIGGRPRHPARAIDKVARAASRAEARWAGPGWKELR